MQINTSKKLITFVIPTRNRQDCLRSLLQSFSRFYAEKSVEFDVVILDNSNDQSLEEDVKKHPFDIKYIYRSDQLSVVENFNQGTEYLTGLYACFMGDDDIISERVFDLAKFMQSNEIDSAIISPKTKGIYFWPGIIDARRGNVGGSLFLSESSGEIQLISLDEAIEKSRSKICDGPQLLPRAYSGLVSKSCIDKVVSLYGALFGGCSPDIYSSRLLSTVVRSHVTVDLPILLAGASKTSTSAQRAERSDIGKLKENDHLGRFQKLNWNSRIPEFYAPFTVWAQSYLQAEEMLGGHLDDESLAYLYAKCLLFTRGNSNFVVDALNQSENRNRQIILTAVHLFKIPIQFLMEKFPSLLLNRNPGGCRHAFLNLPSSFDATICLDSRIRAINFKFVK